MAEQKMPPWLYELYGIPNPNDPDADDFEAWEKEMDS